MLCLCRVYYLSEREKHRDVRHCSIKSNIAETISHVCVKNIKALSVFCLFGCPASTLVSQSPSSLSSFFSSQHLSTLVPPHNTFPSHCSRLLSFSSFTKSFHLCFLLIIGIHPSILMSNRSRCGWQLSADTLLLFAHINLRWKHASQTNTSPSKFYSIWKNILRGVLCFCCTTHWLFHIQPIALKCIKVFLTRH